MNLRGLPEGPPVKWACILVWLCVHSDPSYVEVQPLDSWHFCQLDWKSICPSLIPFEDPEDHQKTAFQKIPHKSSAASCKSPWQSFCLPGLGLGIQAILHQGNSPNWWYRARNQIFPPTHPQKPDYWFPHVDFSFAILLYVPFFDKCSLQLINTPLSSYEFLLLAFVPWLRR
ncbi:hypothetical protein TNCT_343801 [Trichonephila clavata]|uniref:Uncharacterized protein n=1 Tax=Trichonephila clavata TaxID=2740835 RepID=A0A8X6FHW1_TRICU|nr:hypothetical protein TNCT_343801 [Trichonephila clavata]